MVFIIKATTPNGDTLLTRGNGFVFDLETAERYNTEGTGWIVRDFFAAQFPPVQFTLTLAPED